MTNSTDVGDVIAIQAEDMTLDGFAVMRGRRADGNKMARATSDEASMSTTFGGDEGVYGIRIHAQDENDGVSKIELKINGVVVGIVKLDTDVDGRGSDNDGFSEFKLDGIEIPTGAKIELTGYRDGGEKLRIDKIELEKTAEMPDSDPFAGARTGGLPAPSPVEEGDSCSFTLEKRGLTVEATLTELSDGSVRIDLEVLSGGHIGDLRGFFFDVSDAEKLDSMSVAGADVTDWRFDANSVKDLGNGANVKGHVVNRLGKFDGGVEIGTKGVGTDDIQSTSFVLSADGGLSLDDFRFQDAAVRLTNVGEEGGSRDKSLKIGGDVGELACDKPEPASLGDFVWFDENADGVQNGSEAGVEGVRVTLIGGGADGEIGTRDDTQEVTTTDANGRYLFTDLNPGEEYKVAFSDLPETTRFTARDQGGDDAADSDADETTGMTRIVTLAPGETDDTLDAGLVAKPDCGPGFVKVTFAEFAAGTVMQNQLLSDFGLTIWATGGSGDAMVFDSYDPTGGDDDLATLNQGKLLIVSEDGDASDPDDAIGGSLTLDFADAATVGDLTVVDIEEVGGTITIYDVDDTTVRSIIEIPANGDGSIATVMVGETNVGRMVVQFAGSGAIDDICIRPGPETRSAEAALGDTVWFDLNADGVQNLGDGETGAAGVTVNLYALVDGSLEFVTSQTTDAAGRYLFTELTPGVDYQVEFTDLPEGYAFTSPNVGDDAADSDADPATGFTGIYTLEDGETNLTADAGLIAVGSIEGRIFCDKDGNGQDDDAMPGMDNGVGPRTVILLDDQGVEVARTETAADGTYIFDGLAAGDYQVRFDVSNLTVQNAGDDATDSDANQLTGTTDAIAVDGAAVTDVDAGVLCFDLEDEGVLGVILGFGGSRFLEYGSNDRTEYVFTGETGRLQVSSTVVPKDGQFGFFPELAGPVTLMFDIEVDANGDLVDGGVNEFFVFNDLNADRAVSPGEEVYGSGKIVAFGAIDTLTDTDQLDFVALVDGGTRQEEFSDLFAGIVAVESLPGESFTGDFTEDFNGLAKGFASELAYDCIC